MAKVIGIIGGSGFEEFPLLKNRSYKKVFTPSGAVSVVTGTVSGKKVVFLPRHDFGHKVPPHKIRYIANILALKKMGVEAIIATAAVGSLVKSIKPGRFVVVNDFLDLTKSREPSMFSRGVVHTDMSSPYDPKLVRLIKNAVKKTVKYLPKETVYAATEGPRFETKAEIRAYRMLGAHVVGMTGVPEVVLANEAGIPYAAIGMITNYAAGITKAPVSEDVIYAAMENKKKIVSEVVMSVLSAI